MRARLLPVLVSLATFTVLAGCGGEESAGTAPVTSTSAPPAATSSPGEKFPDVEKAALTPSGKGFTLAVMVSSPYDSPERYADGWRVTKAGTDDVLGDHMLGHDHASEQPFTREQTGLKIPGDVKQITVEGRDRANGYGGDTVTIDVL